MIVLFLLFCIASLGMTHIIVDSTLFGHIKEKITDKVPEWLMEMMSCSQCSGYWAGAICGSILLTPELVPSFTGFFSFIWVCISVILLFFVFGCAGSYLGIVSPSILNLIDSKIVYNVGENKGSEK